MLPIHELPRFSKLKEEFPKADIWYVPDIFGKELSPGVFVIGKPKDPREPYDKRESL